MKNTVVILQKGTERCRMTKTDYSSLRNIRVEFEHNMHIGSSLHYEYMSRDEANKLYVDMISKGFKRFRNVREVSWYATADKDTYIPSSEPKWKTEGIWFIPYTE